MLAGRSYNKRVDFGLHALGGSGVGRYGTGGLADASVRADGTFDLIRSYQGLATLEWHGPKLDVYFNAGAEYASRAASFDPITGKAVGYGSPSSTTRGCFTETGPGSGGFLPGGLSSCTADTRVLIEGTAGFWFKLYDGSKEKVNKGRVQFGPQFSYVTRNAWSGRRHLTNRTESTAWSSRRSVITCRKRMKRHRSSSIASHRHLEQNLTGCRFLLCKEC